MIGKTLLVIAMLGALVTLSVASAQEHAAPKTAEAPILPLSPKLRSALMAEMAGVKAGVADISGLLATGEWGTVATRAERIRDSYIMKQKLSRAELEDLERALPKDFIEMDSAFHRHAEGLAHAAKAGNYELSAFYFSKMMEGCGACHARYATHAFKGYKQANQSEAAH